MARADGVADEPRPSDLGLAPACPKRPTSSHCRGAGNGPQDIDLFNPPDLTSDFRIRVRPLVVAVDWPYPVPDHDGVGFWAPSAYRSSLKFPGCPLLSYSAPEMGPAKMRGSNTSLDQGFGRVCARARSSGLPPGQSQTSPFAQRRHSISGQVPEFSARLPQARLCALCLQLGSNSFRDPD
jgi:hypothetical protein